MRRVGGADRETTEDDVDLRSAKTGPSALATESCASLTLTFEGGRPRAAAPFDLSQVDAVTFGRGPEVSPPLLSSLEGARRLTVSLRDRWMSTVHAQCRRTTLGWELEDGDSKNGSRLNGLETTRALLRDGDLVELGRSFFVFRASGAAPGLSALQRLESAGLVTANTTLMNRFDRLAVVAPSSLSVLIHGETGAGKEVVARAIHRLSKRTGPFQAVNCGALTLSLIESELFGHRKSSFTGATEDRLGLVRAADKGTLFLDEIGDLPPEGQVALLRVLQEREVLPVGGTKPLPVDIRVVAATHRNLRDLVTRDRFRADLLGRLDGHVIALPALRERIEDVGILARALVKRHAPHRVDTVEFASGVVRALHGHHWPSNIRELEKTLQGALIFSDATGAIELEHLPEDLRDSKRSGSGTALGPRQTPSREQVLSAVCRHSGNLTAVAVEMHTSRSQIHRLLKRYSVSPDEYREKA